MDSRNFSRRDALRLLLGTGAALSVPSLAWGVTQGDIDAANSSLSDAQAQLDSAQATLDAIAADYERLSEEQSKTLGQIEDKQKQIDEVQAGIDKKQEELEKKQEILSKRISAAYKAGGNDFLSVLLSSTSLEELASNIYYMDKISENDREMIESVKLLKQQLEDQKRQLEQEKADLEALSAQQQEQLDQMQAKQAEAQSTIDGLSQEVKDLMAQRDSELATMAQERAAQRAAAASSGSKAVDVTGRIVDPGSTTGSQAAVLNACASTPSPGPGLCAMWVSQVFSNAGFGYASGNANDMYNSYCHSSDKSAIKPGMIVAVSTHAHTTAGRIYGHIGIYIGGGMMMDNVGYIRTISLDSWISYYSTTVTPRWGWLMGIALA